MDLVYEKYIALLEVREQCRHVARLFDGRAGGGAHLRPHFIRDDVSESRLPQTRRPGQQDMIESFAPFSRGLDVNTKVPGDFTLTDIFGKASGTQGEIELAIFLGYDSAESFGCVTCFRTRRTQMD